MFFLCEAKRGLGYGKRLTNVAIFDNTICPWTVKSFCQDYSCWNFSKATKILLPSHFFTLPEHIEWSK